MTNASTASGREPVDVPTWVRAAGEGDAARVKSLLAAGADVNAALESGETALIRAASKGRLEVVWLLLEAGADPNAEKEDGFTALGVAVFFGYADIVRALLAGGADPTAKGRLGTTAEKWALFSGYSEIVELLKDYDSAGARGSAGDAASTVKTGAPMLFPPQGAFRPVVPLSKLDESEASKGELTAGASPESAAREIARDDDEGPEPNDQEVVTLVPRRSSSSTPPLPARAARPQVPRQPWPRMLVILGLSMMAGLIVGAYVMMGARRSAETRRAAPPVAEAAPAAEAGNQKLESQSATTTSDSQPPLPATVVPAAETDTKTERTDGAEADIKTERADGAKVAPTPEPRPTASENRRAPRAEPESRSGATSAGRSPSHASEEKTGGVRRDAVASRPAQRTKGQVKTASPREISPPVFSPTPPAKSEKSKVIPWP